MLQTLLGSILSDFSGHKDNNNNVLEWIVKEDVNISSFELERSNDAINFSPLGTIQAVGNSSELTNYTYIDEYPGLGIKYYRLKMIKDDGSFKYSNIVALTRENNSNLRQLNVFPNPTEEIFMVRFQADVDTRMEYIIRDIIGQEIMTGLHDISEGINNVEVDLGAAAAGTYIISMTIDGQRINRKIRKAK